MVDSIFCQCGCVFAMRIGGVRRLGLEGTLLLYLTPKHSLFGNLAGSISLGRHR